MQNAIRWSLLTSLSVFLGALSFAQPAPDAAGSADPAPTNRAPGTAGDADQTLRSYLRLQEQLHAALLAVEQARLETSLEARTNAGLLTDRLNSLERTLASERQQQQQAERNANRVLMILAAVVLGLGLAALAMMTVLQTRGMNRLAEIALNTSGERSQGLAQLDSLPGPAPTLLLSESTKVPDSDRLLATIGRLEARIHELEHSARRTLGPGTTVQETTAAETVSGGKLSGTQADQIAGLLGKGQTLLQLGQAAEALQCFDRVIVTVPDHPEAYLGKGLALERLERFEEALKCYDRSMESGRPHTQASLRKAEILTRQERFAEALECYEQALRADAKP